MKKQTTDNELAAIYADEFAMLKNIGKEYADRLGHYVYALIDPRGNSIFYIGKGQRTRMLDHVVEALSSPVPTVEEGDSEKIAKIKDIHAAGMKVGLQILHYGLTSEHAFIVESVLIDVFANLEGISVENLGELTNAVNGWDCAHGVCSIGELHDKMQGQPQLSVDNGDRLLLIRINDVEGSSDKAIYERVRRAWVLNPCRADKADYVAACLHGVVVGLYENQSGWRPDPKSPAATNRYCFAGVPVADPAVRERYIQHRVRIPRGASNPVMYIGSWD